MRSARLQRLPGLAGLALALGGIHAPGFSHAQVTRLEVSPDTTIAIGGEVLGRDEVGEDDLAGAVTFTGTGVALPIGANLTAFQRLAGGGALLSTDITVDLPGPAIARPGDVVQQTVGDPTLAFVASTAGLPPGAHVDAVAELGSDLLVSFDTTVSLGGVVAADEDLVRVPAGGGAPSLFYDGSAHGIAVGLDLDGADRLPDGRLLLSFDRTGSAGGVTFADEDAVLFDPVAGSYALAYDGSAEHAAWVASDLDALDLPPDSDGDGISEALDVCPFWAQTTSADNDGDGRGNECECGDQNGDGRNTVSDIVAINVAIFNPALVTPLCDANNDGPCNVSDIVAVNVDIFSPTSDATCARQPIPGP
jgi:hypothetical protein